MQGSSCNSPARVLVALLSLIACNSVTHSRGPDKSSFIAIPEGGHEMADAEPRLIAASKNRARRIGDNLILRLPTAKAERSIATTRDARMDRNIAMATF